jgi:hypothetical protein
MPDNEIFRLLHPSPEAISMGLGYCKITKGLYFQILPDYKRISADIERGLNAAGIGNCIKINIGSKIDFYLTGIPDSVHGALETLQNIVKNTLNSQPAETFFVRERDIYEELWHRTKYTTPTDESNARIVPKLDFDNLQKSYGNLVAAKQKLADELSVAQTANAGLTSANADLASKLKANSYGTGNQDLIARIKASEDMVGILKESQESLIWTSGMLESRLFSEKYDEVAAARKIHADYARTGTLPAEQTSRRPTDEAVRNAYHVITLYESLHRDDVPIMVHHKGNTATIIAPVNPEPKGQVSLELYRALSDYAAKLNPKSSVSIDGRIDYLTIIRIKGAPGNLKQSLLEALAEPADKALLRLQVSETEKPEMKEKPVITNGLLQFLDSKKAMFPTYSAFQKATGITHGTYISVKTGHRPTERTLDLISKGTNTPLEELRKYAQIGTPAAEQGLTGNQLLRQEIMAQGGVSNVAKKTGLHTSKIYFYMTNAQTGDRAFLLSLTKSMGLSVEMTGKILSAFHHQI